MRVGTSFKLVLSSLSFLLLFLPFSTSLSDKNAIPSRTLDALLQDYAFKALLSPKTGVPYDAQVSTNLSGVEVSALRLRSGSLRTRGVKNYNEFQIPIGVVEQPYVERLVLVYHNLGNLSEKIYPLPGYTYLSPVVGLLAYSGANLSASDLPELDLRASEKPILVKFNDVKKAPFGSVAKCVYFDLHGSVQFDVLLDGSVCATSQQGHFSIVVESNDDAPSPAPTIDEGNGGEKKKKPWIWIIVASVVGGFVLLILLSLLIVKVRSNRRMKIQQLEWAADSNETLQMKSIGDSKAPLAMSTRTRPMLENDYIP